MPILHSSVTCSAEHMVRPRQPLRLRLLIAAAIGWSAVACCCAAASAQPSAASPEAAIVYSAERAQSSGTSGSSFWLQGAGIDVAIPVYKGISVAGSFNGAHASNIQPGVGLSKITYLIGPRYTLGVVHSSSVQVFGQALFGGAHAYGGLFPSGGEIEYSQSAFALQLGGGVDLALRHGFGLRAPQVDYIRTNLSNGGSNTQNDLRVAFGVYFRPRAR